MNIEIKGETYELKLGYKFSHALDKIYTVKQDIGGGQNVEFGVGVTFLYSYLSMANFDAIVRFYTEGLNYLKKRPANDDIIEAIEDLASEKGLQAVADECVEGLRESGFYNHVLEAEKEKK